jgi:hypothetical protein
VRSNTCPIHNDPFFSQRAAKLARVAAAAEHASVYIAFACKADMDSGSDYRYSATCKENFEQETLGVFFSVNAANRCAKE